MHISIQNQAEEVVSVLVKSCSSNGQIGYMSTSIYDTAWLSVISRPVQQTDMNGNVARATEHWLFPECCEYLLAHQLPYGAWESYATSADGILNTAAALLSLKKRLKQNPDETDWLGRAHRAETELAKMLNALDLDSIDQVGFELLLTSLLQLLRMKMCT